MKNAPTALAWALALTVSLSGCTDIERWEESDDGRGLTLRDGAPQAQVSARTGRENASLLIDAGASRNGHWPIVSYQLTALDVPAHWRGQLPPSTPSPSPRFQLHTGELDSDARLRFRLSVRDSANNVDHREIEVLVRADTEAAGNRAPRASSQCLAFSGAATAPTAALDTLVSDPDGDALRYSLSREPSAGAVVIDPLSGEFSYTPDSTRRGYLDHFGYRVEDEHGAHAIGRVALIVGSLRVMPLGDSITFGVTGYTGATGDRPVINQAVGYRQALRELLDAGGFDVDFVGPLRAGWDAGLADAEHAGFPGWKAGELAAGRSSRPTDGSINDWLDQGRPDMVLLHAGTNDWSADAGVLNPLMARLDNWRANEQPVQILLSNMIDQRRDNGRDRSHVDAFNAGVPAIADSYADTALVDQFSALDWRTDLSPWAQDSVGLHPNAQGYRKMAETWYRAMLASGKLQRCP